MWRDLENVLAVLFITLFGAGFGAAAAGAAGISSLFLGMAVILGAFILYKRGV